MPDPFLIFETQTIPESEPTCELPASTVTTCTFQLTEFQKGVLVGAIMVFIIMELI